MAANSATTALTVTHDRLTLRGNYRASSSTSFWEKDAPVREGDWGMSSPTFASPSFEELGGRRESATPAAAPHSRGGGMRGGLAVILNLGCIAVAGALTVGVFFGLA